MDYIAVTERFVAQHFPSASVVVIAGSTARGTRTATSDIDLLVLGESACGDDRTSLAATYRFEGEVFEVFAYTEAGFATWAQRGFAQHRPVIVQMLLDGVTVRGADERERYIEEWSDAYRAGPRLESDEERFRRYVITDLLDDYTDCADPVERHILAALLYEKTAELMLLAHSHWIGAGKYLPRRLAEWDAGRAAALSTPLTSGDHEGFAAQVAVELDRAGGRMQEGFRR